VSVRQPVAASLTAPAAFPRVPVLALAAGLGAALLALSGRYGPHRDEMYFLAAGRHLAWGYPDQPPLAPALARLMDTVAPGSLPVLRAPSALCAAAVVVLTGLMSRELGAGPRGQVVAAGCAAVSSLVFQTGHLLSTATLELVAWAAVTGLAAGAVRTGADRLWLPAGVALGVGAVANALAAALGLGLLAGVLLAGPRRLLASPWVWAGAVVAAACAAPYAGWQAAHGWPQLHLAGAIAAGQSGSSQSRLLLLPYQLLLVSPVLAPVWIAGLWRLLRHADARPWRFLGVCWVVLAALFLVAGGKPYYLGLLLPLLLAAGAVPAERWLARGRARLREGLLVAAYALSVLIGGAITLPLLPVDLVGRSGVVVANYDAGETIGWPAFAATVARAYDALPATDRQRAVLLSANYGEAGAIDRYGPALGLPHAYSGHNAYGLWGPPPSGAQPVVVAGYGDPATAARVTRWFAGCHVVARIDNGHDVDNEEQGAPVRVCARPRQQWSVLWPQVRRLG